MQMNKLAALILCGIIGTSIIGCGTREWPPVDEEASASISDNDSSIVNPEQDLSNTESVTTTAKATTTKVVTTTTKITTATSSTTAVTTTTVEAVTTTTAASDNVSQTDGLSFSIVQTNSWEADGKTVYQFECIINNATANAVTSWSIEMPAVDASILQGWSAKYDISDGVLNITPDEYNAEIAANGTFSLGFQLSTISPVDTSQARLAANGVSIAPMP